SPERPVLEAPAVRNPRRVFRKSGRFSMGDKKRPSQERTIARDGLHISDRRDDKDELAALDQENRRLKRLMITKLRQENAALRSRLRRFHVE
ncbi:MAG: hypothetical protein KGI75_23125, partial [Rhizobiaceae bacterium]|nr:hypothetical protein [Rhizobiaceae bacterium]